MKTEKKYCFTYSPGEDIYLFSLRNAKGTEVLVTNYGAIITAFKIKQRDHSINDIVLGFDKVEGYLSGEYMDQYPWFGCAIGRYANRIKDASFNINGHTYNLVPNRPNEHLHGGFNGFDKKVWQLVGIGETPCAFLELKCQSKDGEEGYPGNIEVSLRFELNDEDELSYQYTATSDQPSAINLTHHSYFNLNNGYGTIEDHELKINASYYLEQDKLLVVNGNLVSVENTDFDFRESHPIGDKSDNVVYDQSFVVDKKRATKELHGLPLVAEAQSKITGIGLQVYSTEPIVHFYSGKWIPAIKGKNGNHYGPLSGFCLETHKHPNAVNIPHFPNTILKPGETYFQKTIYKITS